MVRKSNGRSDRVRRRETEKRRAILRAAARAFRRRGFAATGMREIAQAADLSAANLYYYFRSKQDLLYFCQDHSLERMLEACRDVSAGDLGADEKLGRVVRAHLDATLDELDGSAAHLEVDGLPEDLRRRIVAKRDRYERAVRAIVAAGVRDGTFAACDEKVVTRAILGALNWTARWYDPAGPTPPAALAQTFSTFLVKGLRP